MASRFFTSHRQSAPCTAYTPATLLGQLQANTRGQLLAELSRPREHRREAAAEVGRGFPERVSGRIAIRLHQLLIHDNKALWGRAAVRLDTLVVTPGAGKEAFRARTEVFPQLRDETYAPLEDLLLYCGPAHRFLDFGIWVSRDQKDVRSLQDLLAESAADSSLTTAITSVAALAVAAPQAAMFAAGATGVATIVKVASQFVTAIAGTSIGLYRRSFLSGEAFGEGRHPADGLIRAQEFSFSFSIQRV